MKYFKLLALGIILVSVAFVCSCSKEKSEIKESDNQNTSISKATPNANIKVYPLVLTDRPVGKKAGDFVWEENGKRIRFSEFTKGKYVLLNFWGTWCPPCRRELPDIVAIAKEMESKGLVVIGAAMERSGSMNEAIEQVSSFWENKQLYYTVVIGTQELADAYGGINAVPTTFLINDKGVVVSTIVGGRSKEDFMKEINTMMKN